MKLGTRASPLARWQAEWVAGQLRQRGQAVELVLITTRGDREQVQAIGAIGGDGLFTKELQRSLLAGEIDLAVHSLKDLPTDSVPGLVLGAVPPRGPTGDLLVTVEGATLDQLRSGAVVGTGSQRRRAQLLHVRPDLEMKEVRGNVDTRLRKLQAGEYDALVLAEAGLARLGLKTPAMQLLPTTIMLPAIGQGALGVECREADQRTRDAIAVLNDRDTECAVIAERTMLRTLSGGCLAPVAGWARVAADGQLTLTAVVLSTDGKTKLSADAKAAPDAAEQLGRNVAEELLRQGAARLIEAARG